MFYEKEIFRYVCTRWCIGSTSKEIAAPYHIDTDPVRLNQAVTIKLTGFIPGAEYTVYAYARECYQKFSEPLSAQIRP